jgi:hypothetical protein
MEVARQNTWVSRVKEFWEIIDKEPKPKF